MGGSSSHTMQNPSFVVNATAKHTGTIIFLHGLGDTGQGWSLGFQAIRHPHIKYVCPTAPVAPVTLNAGFRMPSWFDIKSLEAGMEEDEQGIKKASDELQSLINQEEKKGIPRNRIMVGGFSQGAAVALYSALTKEQKPLAGIIALSTWLPLHKAFPQSVKANTETPIIQCHGDADPLVRYDFGQMTAHLLKSFIKNHEFKSYPGMMHSSCDQEMSDVRSFIEKYMPPV